MAEENVEQFRKSPAAEFALERHYTVAEISELWHLDAKTVRRLFAQEPGVLWICSDEGRYRRAYRSLRIPESVMLRMHRSMSRVS
jgi:hypothetical protein